MKQQLPKIILASGSPRRKQLLEACGLSFTVRSVNADESFSEDMEADQVAEYLALKKADAYGTPSEGEVVITADTTVISKGKVLNKPQDEAEALKMLTELQGSEHSVVSGVCIFTAHDKISFSETTKVSFYPLNKNELLDYIRTKKPYDKAGSYGIQESLGIKAVKHINGSYTNVVGIPAARVYREIKKLTPIK